MEKSTPTFIKLPRNKRFNFKARFYDVQKEELDQRVSAIQAEIAQEKKLKIGEKNLDYDAELARFKMSQEWRNGTTRQSQFNQSNMRVAFIAGFLFLVAYYYLYL